MAEKLIGSLLYDEHPEPRKARPLKDRLKVPIALLLALAIGGGLLYTFINYREESRVRVFLDTLGEDRYEDAYAMWDGDERYDINRFLEDWGEQGYYTTGMTTWDVIDSNTRGSRVVVYATVNDGFPVAILVDKETLLLSFSPDNKYSGRRR